MLLTKANQIIRLWTWTEVGLSHVLGTQMRTQTMKMGIEKRSFVRKLPVEAIHWLPDNECVCGTCNATLSVSKLPFCSLPFG